MPQNPTETEPNTVSRAECVLNGDEQTDAKRVDSVSLPKVWKAKRHLEYTEIDILLLQRT